WQTANIKSGVYDLLVDGKFAQSVKDDEIKRGMLVKSGLEFDQATELIETIRAKNRLFFYRSRPENNTYLFLFRKHEQGQNAKEIPQFDPLIAEQEKKIDTLKKPLKHTLELVAHDASRENAAAKASPPPPVTLPKT